MHEKPWLGWPAVKYVYLMQKPCKRPECTPLREPNGRHPSRRPKHLLFEQVLPQSNCIWSLVAQLPVWPLRHLILHLLTRKKVPGTQVCIDWSSTATADWKKKRIKGHRAAFWSQKLNSTLLWSENVLFGYDYMTHFLWELYCSLLLWLISLRAFHSKLHTII